VRVCAPATLNFTEKEQFTKEYGVEFVDKAEDAVKGADVVMALRLQLERMDKGLIPSIAEYNAFYGVTDDLVKLAKPTAMVMHPGPANRGLEINSTVMDGDKSLITTQVTNGVAVRMAIMTILAENRRATKGGKK
jgi:aspartate carbamoyltransferase catalytic subunit